MKKIKDYDNYFIDEYGNIYHNRFKKLTKMKPYIDSKNKYYMIGLVKDGKRKKHLIHRLVAQTFIKNPENKPEVNHKDLNSKNDYVGNLEWVTHKENMEHAFKFKSPVRNQVKRYLLSPNGEEHYFDNFSLLKKFVKENNIDVSTSSLNCYGKSRGYIMKNL